jgi:hypothetical protein
MLQALRRAYRGPACTGYSADEAALIIDLISLLIGGTTLAVVLYQLYESKRRVEIDFSVELRHIAPWPSPMPTAIFWVTPLGKTRRGFTGCWYDIARGKRLVQFDSHSSEGLRIGSSSADSPQDSGTHAVLAEPVAPGDPHQLYSLVQPLAQRLLEERYVFDATIRFVVEDYEGHQYGKTIKIGDLRAWAEGRKGTVRVVPSWWRRLFGS